ncbi:DUF2975 domain-containing protein [Lentzea sp. JNUCC 0626]|uniref:DUF2975 domain-containing protein n=1 Tax=Lentzea sp. JNUCC 0626 TaxID=3367513 RepID=UPI003748F054
MISERWAVIALRFFLVALFGVLVMLETLSIPGSYRYSLEQHPDRAGENLAIMIVAIFWVLCVQVVLVATWKLLTLVRKDLIFTEAAIKWVDVMVWAIAAGWVVLVAVFIYLGTIADDPGVLVLFFVLTTGVSVIGLVLVVMRALLQRATTLRSEMESVI